SPSDNWTPSDESMFRQKIIEPLLQCLRRERIEFRGLLFPGLILTGDGPRVLEFNCRFGDPETQSIVPRMKSDLVPLLEATIDGRLHNESIEWDDRAAVTVVLASEGYPGKYPTGRPISGLDIARRMDDVQIFHAGTRLEN